MGNVRSIISEHAERLRALNAEIHRTFEKAPHGSEHHAACRVFHSEFDRLAFPGGLQRGLAQLKALDPEAIEVAVQFLEEDPWFHRSGYIKEEIVRRLKKAPLKPEQRSRLAAVVAASVCRGPRRIAQHVARLAPIVASPAFVRNMETQAKSDDPELRRRAEHVISVLCRQAEIKDRS